MQKKRQLLGKGFRTVASSSRKFKNSDIIQQKVPWLLVCFVFFSFFLSLLYKYIYKTKYTFCTIPLGLEPKTSQIISISLPLELRLMGLGALLLIWLFESHNMSECCRDRKRERQRNKKLVYQVNHNIKNEISKITKKKF